MSVVLEFKRPSKPATKSPIAAGATIKTAKGRKWLPPTKEYVRAEAEYDAERNGETQYTNYLKLYGRYPSPQQTTAMAVLLGTRLKADDGKLYPMPTAAERRARRIAQQERRESLRFFEQEANVDASVRYLARNDIDPATIAERFDDPFMNPGMDRDLEKALDWLQRFAIAGRKRHPIKQDDLVPPR
jgi:hypothetical protein